MFIKMFQCDAVSCSDVYKAFLVMEEKIHKMSNVCLEKREYLVKLVKHRFNFMYGDAHGVCYLLDPRYLGNDMTWSLCNEIEDLIYNFPKNDGTTNNERQEQLAQEYTAFRIEALRERQQNTLHSKFIGQSNQFFSGGRPMPLIGHYCKIWPTVCFPWQHQVLQVNAAFPLLVSFIPNYATIWTQRKLRN